MDFLDLVIVGALLCGGLIGYRKGLLNSVMSIIRSIIAIAVAMITYKSLALFCMEQFGIGKVVAKFVRNTFTLPVAVLSKPFSNEFEQLTSITGVLPVNYQKELQEVFVASLNSVIGNSIKTIGDAISQFLALAILSAIAFFLVFIITYFVLGFFSKIVTKVLDRSLFGNVNHSGGFVAGLILAALVITLADGLVLPLFSLYSPSFNRQVDHSILVPFLKQFFAVIISRFG